MSSAADRGDATVVSWTPPERPAHRLIFEPRDGGGYERVEQMRDGERWRTLGAEYVEQLTIENGGQA